MEAQGICRGVLHLAITTDVQFGALNASWFHVTGKLVLLEVVWQIKYSVAVFTWDLAKCLNYSVQ